MLFLSILLVLFIERILWDGAQYRHHHWFALYWGKAESSSLLGLIPSEMARLATIVLLPTALIGWLATSVLSGLGTLFEFAFASLVLLYTLGPRDLGRDTEQYLQAKLNNDKDQLKTSLQHFHTPSPSENADDQVVQGILAGTCQRLLGPMLWFGIFGPTGAVLYRLTHLAAAQTNLGTNQALISAACKLQGIVDWLPARLTALGYAIAGNFDTVTAAWKNHGDTTQNALDCHSETNLLLATGQAALNERSDEHTSTGRIDAAMTLAWRAVGLWVGLIGLGALLSTL